MRRYSSLININLSSKEGHFCNKERKMIQALLRRKRTHIILKYTEVLVYFYFNPASHFLSLVMYRTILIQYKCVPKFENFDLDLL